MNIDTTTYGHQYPELDKRIREKDAELKCKAQKDAKFLGMQNRPAPGDKSLTPYIGFIRSGYEELQAQVTRLIQPDMHTAKMQAHSVASEQKQAELAVKINRLTHENNIAENDLGGKVPDPRHGKNTLGWLFLGAIYLAELVFNAMCFEFFGDSLLFAFCIALGISVCMFFLSRGIVSFFERAKTEGTRMYLVSGTLAALAIALCFVLSYWRSTLLNATGNVSVNPGLFTVINLALLAGSMLISYFHFPKREEKEAERELRTRFESIENRKKEIKQLTTEKDALEAQTREQVLHHQQIISLADHAMHHIDTLYRECTETFKSTLLAHRDDRITPDCFFEPIPSLNR